MSNKVLNTQSAFNEKGKPTWMPAQLNEKPKHEEQASLIEWADAMEKLKVWKGGKAVE